MLQGGGALGAYEVGAVEYLYEHGMECAIVSGASAGAMNAATLAGATRYPPQVLRELWEKLAVDSPIPLLPDIPIPLLPQWLRQLWFYYVPSLWVPNMYRPRLDFWNLPTWTYVAKPTLKRTLEDLLDWDQGTGFGAHAAERLGERRRKRRGHVLQQPSSEEASPRAGVLGRALRSGACAGQRELPGRLPLGQWSGTGPTGMAA